MRLVMDADGLIKLYRAGLLARVHRAFTCVIPDAVHFEVVTKGKARLHQDAEAIEGIIAEAVTVVPVRGQQPELGLGAGEAAILNLLSQEQDPIVVSDDRRFLSLLATQGTPFLTPADILVLLRRRGIVTADEATEALERLRPAIRMVAYWEARHDLASGEESR